MSSQTVNKEMALVEKVKMIEVNPRYDMTGLQLVELAEAAAGGHSLFLQNQFLDAVHLGFKLGYQQGGKAVKKKADGYHLSWHTAASCLPTHSKQISQIIISKIKKNPLPLVSRVFSDTYLNLPPSSSPASSSSSSPASPESPPPLSHR